MILLSGDYVCESFFYRVLLRREGLRDCGLTLLIREQDILKSSLEPKGCRPVLSSVSELKGDSGKH